MLKQQRSAQQAQATLDTGFQRRHRLLNSADFKPVFETHPWKSSDRYLTVLAICNHKPAARLGMVFMKKRVKLAVQRNRLKRLTRHSFRFHKQQLAGLDLVVLARSGAAEASNPVLSRSLQKHWQRILKSKSLQSQSLK
ncbi:ribonuclease P protein component [Candidatus Venteria ishoeyi]|uniref:Ribonuclease P protein component n=1 Tax=Candidatus Venteria ishoeyi TaxID=1899563 RepID=A0A1H6FA43_9GAMM|nr:ribonuclease P protein component [Candidatus Venteria ishoeyi]MDM8546318.1 ribonuclease P protein component [Candidatus Venteria ishoeyi]SEH06958.1 Ribonuclease P protein component [Candidatus Venteria ishoeyi]